MLNGRGTLCIILGIVFILFLTFSALGQGVPSGEDNSALPQSQVIEIIKEIHASETRVRNHVDGSERRTREYIDNKFEKLEGKFEKLDKEVAVLNNAKWYVTIIIAPISVYCIMLLVQMFSRWKSNRLSKNVNPSKEVEVDGFLDDSKSGY